MSRSNFDSVLTTGKHLRVQYNKVKEMYLMSNHWLLCFILKDSKQLKKFM